MEGTASLSVPDALASNCDANKNNDASINEPDEPAATAAFSFVCLGVGGGPFDDDCSCYVMKPADRAWHEGTVLVEGGSFLGSLKKCLQPPDSVFYDAEFPPNVDADGRTEIFNSWINNVFISHGHLDHIYGLVLASANNRVQRPVYGLEDTLETILTVFNGRIWPRLASYDESDPMAFYHLRTLKINAPLRIAPEVDVTAFPISHGPARLSEGTTCFNDEILHAEPIEHPPCEMDGTFCRTVSTAFLFTNHRRDMDVLFMGDVEPDLVCHSSCNSTLWENVAPRAAQNKLKAVFLECSFSSEQPTHLLFGHLTPEYLYKELECLARHVRLCQEQDENLLEGSLRGLKCIVIHLKGLVLSADPSYTTCTPVPKSSSSEHLPLPVPLRERIQNELDALESKKRLGVEFIIAQRGQRIGTFHATLANCAEC